MGLAEEEVLIRDDSGLLLDVGETRVPKSQEWTKKFTKTVCLSLGFLVLGLCVAIPGPTLLDLEDQVKATTFEMMIVFASRSVGYLLGALLGGVLFDCFDKQLLLFCTLLLSSVATVAIPWSLTLVVMATMFALQGITMGALDTGGNVFCIQLWGKKNPPFIQTLHFAFGIGAFVAPLLAKPFLSNGNLVPNTTSIVQGNIPVAPFLTGHLHSNITRRSVEIPYPALNDHYMDLKVSFYEMKHDMKREILPVLSMKEGSYKLAKHERLRRQTGSTDDGYIGLWRWKKHKSRRASTEDNSDEPAEGSVTPKVDNPVKTSENQIIPTKETGKGPDDDNDSKDKDVENTPKTDNKNNTEPERLVLDSSQNGVSVDIKTNNMSSMPEAKTNVSEVPSDKNGVTNSEVTTMITTFSTTKKFHKPSAATDSDRQPETADGKVIAKHLDAMPKTVVDDDKDDKSKNDVDLTSTAGGNEKLDNLTASANNGNETGIVNSTISNNSTAVNISLFASNTSSANTSSVESDINLKTVSSTMKPNNLSDIVGSTNTAKVTSDGNKKLSTEPPNTTTTETSTTTTKKPTTQPTTTKKTTTTVSTTTTESVTTKKELEKTTKQITSSTKKVDTTAEKLTPATTTKEETTESSAQKTTPLKQPKQDEGETEKTPTKITTTPKVTTTNSSVISISTTNTTLPDDKLSTTEVSMKPESTGDGFFNNAIHAVKNISKIQFAYLITGLALFLIAILFLVLYCKDKRRFTSGRDLEDLERFRSSVTRSKAVLILLLGVFFFCYMGLEVTYGALVTTFAVDFNRWPKEQGAMAAAIFWGSLAAGRGLSIFLSKCCGPTVMLIIDLIFMIIGGLVLSIGIHFYDKLLWLGTLVLGLGMSSAFPAGISWAENYFHLTGKSTAFFVIGSALGQMFVPVITGYLYEYLGAIVLMYTSLVLSVMTLFIFLLMQCVAVKRGATLKIHDRNGFLPLEEDDNNEENLEMEDFVHFDKSQARMRRDKRGRGNAEYHTLISDLDDD